MAKQPADTRKRILDAAYRLYYRKGFSRVSVDAVAELAGVTKRTVYYHFDSKDQVVAAMIEIQHLQLMKQYRSWLEPSSNSAPDIVTSLFSKLKHWADGPDWLGSGFSRIAAELADLRGHPARVASRSHKAAVEAWLGDQFAAVGVGEPKALAKQIMILIEGGMSLALIHNDTAYIETAMRAAESLVGNSKVALHRGP
ncbi:TetR family transcriptional regulator [Rhodobacterales bacterium HKCCSP123]|nr:TetR family transcriptional regulator [Rhodobacterales bacterium HKCCSP123]